MKIVLQITMQIKINNEIFNCSDGGVQLSFGSHASIHLNFDLSNYPYYEKFFVKLHETNNKFTIISSKCLYGKPLLFFNSFANHSTAVCFISLI